MSLSDESPQISFHFSSLFIIALLYQMAEQTKFWTFTLIIGAAMPADLAAPIYIAAEMAYLVYQIEFSPSGTFHYQGYVRFNTRKRMERVKTLFEQPTMHLEQAKGSEEQNRSYCMKDDTRAPGEVPHEFGVYDATQNKKGHRSDLDEIVDKCSRNVPLKDIALAHGSDFIRYHQGIRALHEMVAPLPPPLKPLLDILVLWGPSGSGKTHRARTSYPTAFLVLPGRSPFDGYSDQETIIFDEWTPQTWPVTEMNTYLDRYSFQLNRRYHNTYGVWTRVVICSNISPVTWYEELQYSCPLLHQAIRRRITGSCRLVELREDQGGPTLDQIRLEAPNPF